MFQTEPLPADSPFWDLPNVFITPHVGGYIVEYEDFILPLIVDNMRLFLAGRQAKCTISSRDKAEELSFRGPPGMTP